MPVPKKRTTTKRETATEESSASPPLLPEQQEFHQHLRILAQSAVRTVLELVMREELDAFIGMPSRKLCNDTYRPLEVIWRSTNWQPIQAGCRWLASASPFL